MIVAEFIYMLSDDYRCSTDDTVVGTDTHVPKLTESMTELFFGDETIYVIFCNTYTKKARRSPLTMEQRIRHVCSLETKRLHCL